MKTKQCGIGLLELMLALAIIASLLIMATRYYQQTNLAKKVAHAIESVQMVRNACLAWRDDIGELKTANNMITGFVAKGYVPAEFASVHANPWGGSITAVATGEDHNLQITLSAVGQKACTNLGEKLTHKINLASYTCNAGQAILLIDGPC